MQASRVHEEAELEYAWAGKVRRWGDFSSRPPNSIGLELFAAGVVSLPVFGDDFCEVVAAGELGEFRQALRMMVSTGAPVSRDSVRACEASRSTTLDMAPPSGLARVARLCMSSA